MARVPYLAAGDMEAADRQLLDRPINLFRALAHNPGALRQLSDFGTWIRYHGCADPRLRELAILAVGLSAEAPYEVSHHAKIGLEFGVTPADLRGIAQVLREQGTEHFTELEVAVLTAARELTLRGELADADWQLLSRELGLPAAVELIVVISFYNMVVRLLAALAVDTEAAYEQYLTFFPGWPAAPDKQPGSSSDRTESP
ncbi:MAG: carboxymuconolactone decarboxylase family protein [Streptosporangiaceae bacterium]